MFLNLQKTQIITFYFYPHLKLPKSTWLPKQYSALSKIKINKVLLFTHDITPKISPHNTMPGWIVIFIKLSFYIGRPVFACFKILKGFFGNCYGLFLHFLWHVCLFYYRSDLHFLMISLNIVEVVIFYKIKLS